MENLTSILLNNENLHDIKSITHQGVVKTSINGRELRYQSNTMPFIGIRITYPNLSYSEIYDLFKTYEENYAKTFILTIEDDIRDELLDSTMNTFIFGAFKFEILAQKRIYTASIELQSSSMYNQTPYNNIRVETESYTPNITTNNEFLSILTQVAPYAVLFDYVNGKLLNTVGANAQYLQGKFLKKRFNLRFVVNGTYLQLLKNFFYKKGNILGTFGLWENGYGITDKFTYSTIEAEVISAGIGLSRWKTTVNGDMNKDGIFQYEDRYYIVNEYVEDGSLFYGSVFADSEPIEYEVPESLAKELRIIKCRFDNSSFDYQKDVQKPNIYYIDFDIVEVKE